MDKMQILKAIADDTRMKILRLLLSHNYCVRSLARNLSLSEATISQHLKVMREAGLLVGEKRGYYMHYNVKRDVLHKLGREIDALATIEGENCSLEKGHCKPGEFMKCNVIAVCDDETKEMCHGKDSVEHECGTHEKCHCHHEHGDD
jgi:Predicted transcriptional regulators